MNDFRKLNDAALIDFARQVATVAGGAGFAGLGAGAGGGFETAISDAADALETAVTDTVTKTAAKLSSSQAKGLTRDALIAALAQANLTARATGASDEDIAAMGFSPYDTSNTLIVPVEPTELSVSGSSNGNNTLKWNRNGNRSGVVFEVVSRVGEGAEHIIGTTKATGFVHSGQTPGEKQTYKVRAKAPRAASTYSNPAVVYG